MLRSEGGIGCHHPPLSILFTEAGSFTEPRAHRLASLASQFAPRSLALQDSLHDTQLLHDAKDPISDLHNCRAKALRTEPSVQPQSALTFYFLLLPVV